MTKVFKRTVIWYALGSTMPLLQAQTDQTVRRPPPGSYTVQPFTEEQEVTKIRTYRTARRRRAPKTIQFTAEDSQRRVFFSETQLATGRRSFTIDDLIAGEKIIWNTNFPIAKMLKYPTLPKAVRPAGRFRRRHWTLGTENRRSACQESLAASRRTERA